MMRFLKRWIMDTLGFSKSEANGTVIMIFVIIAVAILPKLYIIYNHDQLRKFQSDTNYLEKWAKELESSLHTKSQKSLEKSPIEIEKIRINQKQFDFDPNHVEASDLLALGFTERTSNNIVKYRDKGGSFKTKKDLKNIYGISQSRVAELWDNILLPEAIEYSTYPAYEKRFENEKESLLLGMDMQLVTAEALQSVNGIGPVLSDRIIKYRDRLGGFHSSSQLMEVYGLSSEIVSTLDSLMIFSDSVTTISLNADSIRILSRHPYIDYHIAKAIFNYGKQHGSIDSISQIKSIKIISDSLYQKIYPYLSIDR